MTKMFGNLTSDNLTESGDRLGGGGPMESGIYTGTVKLAYAGKSRSSDAQSVVVHIDVNGNEFRETHWVTNKNGENFYLDKQDQTKKHPLPGFTHVDDLCLLTTGFGLAEQDIEEKVVSLYDFEARQEVPQNVPVLTGLLGKEITVGVVKQTVDKTAKDANGKYNPTGETRDENVADKFFHTETKRTVTEIKTGQEEAIFHDKWKEKNTGKTRNRAKGAEGNSGAPGRKAGNAGAPGSAGGAQKPATSLFGG